MEDYWQSTPANKIADSMKNLPKIVFSKTLQKVEWKSSMLVKDNIAEEILTLK
jgi:hypothetical protein